MGAYSPAPIINRELEKKILSKIIKPTLLALKKKKSPYNGFLYVGLMIKNNEPYLIEYNVRMGDPECQVILPRLKTDFLKVITSAIENKLHKFFSILGVIFFVVWVYSSLFGLYLAAYLFELRCIQLFIIIPMNVFVVFIQSPCYVTFAA